MYDWAHSLDGGLRNKSQTPVTVLYVMYKYVRSMYLCMYVLYVLYMYMYLHDGYVCTYL